MVSTCMTSECGLAVRGLACGYLRTEVRSPQGFGTPRTGHGGTRSGAGPFALDGRAALVTGGNREIGRAVALPFAGAGARVVVTGRDPGKNPAVAWELGGRGWPCRST
jgi:hypothetical protein